MAGAGALRLALQLMETPQLAGAIRRQPLPSDTLKLIQIAGGRGAELRVAATSTGRSEEAVRKAAILYLQQVLFVPGADHYRVLGTEAGAAQETLRQHMHGLMRWLHPDRTSTDWESAFAARVLSAWDTLKNPERRRRYDRTLPAIPPSERTDRAGRPKIYRPAPAHQVPWISGVKFRRASNHRRWLRTFPSLDRGAD